jgi:uncharacterized membrane protein
MIAESRLIHRIGYGLGLVFSLCGIAFMSYLVYVHFLPEGADTICNFSAGFSCEIVNKSAFAEMFGVPISVLGLVYFLASSAFFLAGWKKHTLVQPLLYFTIFSLVFSLYLTLVEVFLLGTLCVFCEASKVAMLGIAYVLWLEVAKRDLRVKWRDIAAVAGVGVGFALIAYSMAV